MTIGLHLKQLCVLFLSRCPAFGEARTRPLLHVGFAPAGVPWTQTPYATRGTRPRQLWTNWGPGVFGRLKLLELTVVFFAGQRGQLNKFLNPSSCIERGGWEKRNWGGSG